MTSSSNSPCAACKAQRRKCTQECVFAPYFPPDNPQRFTYVHKVFGASNVTKLLNELDATQRDDAVKSLAYEAEARLRDPVYGCVGVISVLQHKLRQIQGELNDAKKELATYIGPQALHGVPTNIIQQQHPNNPFVNSLYPYNNVNVAAAAQMMICDSQPPPSQHPIMEAQQLAAALVEREQQEMLRSFEHQQQQQEFLRFSGGFDVDSGSSGGGFNQVSPAAAAAVASSDQLSPSLTLGSFDNTYHHMQQVQGEPQPHHHPLQAHAQLLLPPQQKQVQTQTQNSSLTHHQQQTESEECRSVGPSC